MDKLNKQDLLYLVAFLRRLAVDKDFQKENGSHSLCTVVIQRLGSYYLGAIKPHFKTWPKFSGCESFPIGGLEFWMKEGSDRWANPDRIELCLYVADCIERGVLGDE